MEKKEETLVQLVSLLKDNNSILIIIEPTNKLTQENVWKLIDNIQTFWFYKGLLLWARAREGKYIDEHIFEQIDNITITKKYFLNDMVCVRYITLN